MCTCARKRASRTSEGDGADVSQQFPETEQPDLHADDASGADPGPESALEQGVEPEPEREAEAEALTVPDPFEEFSATLWAQPGDWYVIHSYAGNENRVKANLENRICSLNMEDYIFEVEVPMEEVTEIKNGQRKRSRPCCPATCWSGWT